MHGLFAVLLVVVVASIAYGSKPAELSVAEFGPSAQRQLDAPPPTDAPSAGAGAAKRRRLSTTTTVPPSSTSTGPAESASTAPTTRVGRARQCYGDPPRQTEDPMAPPCVPTLFDGDNGGATSSGVSGTEIRIGIPGVAETSGSYVPTIKALFELFNAKYEFYGRRLVPVFANVSGSGPEWARALAAELASQKVFAAATGIYEWWAGPATFPAQLARDHIVTVVRGNNTWWTDKALYDEYHPYVWSAYPSSEDIQRNLADFACTALAGKPAIHAGDTSLVTKTRRFGILAYGWESSAPSATILTQAMADCTGIAPVVVNMGRTSSTAADRKTLFNRLKNDGVTTLFCVCEGYVGENLYTEVHQAGFHPEWVFNAITTREGNDESGAQAFVKSSGLAPPIRVNASARLLPLQARPWYYAVAPVLAKPGAFLYGEVAMAEFFYPALSVLAAGIQGAGPNLTPESFAAALMSTQFPNPGAGQPPFWQPSAGFGPGDHSFYDDYHVAWFSPDADALDTLAGSTPKGSWCYLDQAKRFRQGTYPADAEARMYTASVPCR